MTLDWWTLALQTINVTVLIWLLAHFFWRPVAAIIEKRRVAAEKLLADAEAAKQEAATASAEIAKLRAGMSSERDAILDAAREEGKKLRDAALLHAKAEVEKTHTAASKNLAEAEEDAKAAWAERAAHLAVDIAQRLVSRLDNASVQHAFVDWLAADVHALPEEVRHAALAEAAPLEVVTPKALSSKEQALYTKKLGEALGGAHALIFSVDPKLVMGVRLQGANLLAESSWRADLEAILTDMGRGEVTHDA